MKPVIIFVDDEKIVLQSYKNSLSNELKEIYDFEYCETGEEALELIDDLKSEGIDIPLVITDHIMPDMNGDEMLQIIHLKYPDILSVMVTGMANLNDVSNAINKAHLYHFIQKPWSNIELHNIIKNTAEHYFIQQEKKRNLKQLAEANEKLKSLDKSKNYMLQLLSHELYTPLNTIIPIIDIIKQENDTTVCSFCNELSDAAQKLKRIAELSLLITNIKSDTYNFRVNEYNLIEILECSLFMRKKCMEKKRIKLVKDLPKSFYVNFDETLIAKTLELIIDNAIKFSSPESQIYVKCENDSHFCVLSIVDEGVGFSEKQLQKPFEYFVSDELMNHSDGIGLGLSVCKTILDRHGFGLEIHNNFDKGAKVNIIFPKKKQ